MQSTSKEITSKSVDELVPQTSIGGKWTFVCSKCHWKGDKSGEVEYHRIPVRNPWVWKTTRFIEVGKYPHRCYECDRNRKRYERMKKALKTLDSWNHHLERNLGPPKMYTIGLISQPDDSRTLHEQILEIKSKWKILRNHLLEEFPNTWRGGISNVEVTHKINFDRTKGNWFGVKYHVHIHAAVLMGYLPPAAFTQFAELPLAFGLGRANIVVRQRGENYGKYKSHLANYMAKYITKGAMSQRSIRFGIMDKRWRRKNDYPLEEPKRKEVGTPTKDASQKER